MYYDETIHIGRLWWLPSSVVIAFASAAMPGTGCCEQYHTNVSQIENLDTVRAGEGVRAQSLI